MQTGFVRIEGPEEITPPIVRSQESWSAAKALCSQFPPYAPPLGEHADYTGCPLCGELQHTDDPELWKEHLLHHCQANERRTGAGAAA